jgi:hypothetical protein
LLQWARENNLDPGEIQVVTVDEAVGVITVTKYLRNEAGKRYCDRSRATGFEHRHRGECEPATLTVQQALIVALPDELAKWAA